MFETFRNAWKIEDLRKKLLYTLLVIVIFRLGCAIPVPFIAPEALQGWVAGQSGSMLGYIDMLTGGSFSRATLFALSVTPYINASIIIQLLTVAIPALERLSKEGEDGRKKLTRITRYTGAGIALALGIGYYFLLRGQGALVYGSGAQMFAQVFSAIVVILAFTAGSLLIQWLGEQIDVKGIGNGISILIFAGIALVLISQRFMPDFHAVFRNSGFVIGTLIMRLSLSAPWPWNIASSIFAAVFVLALTWATTYFGPSRLRKPLPR